MEICRRLKRAVNQLQLILCPQLENRNGIQILPLVSNA